MAVINIKMILLDPGGDIPVIVSDADIALSVAPAVGSACAAGTKVNLITKSAGWQRQR